MKTTLLALILAFAATCAFADEPGAPAQNGNSGTTTAKKTKKHHKKKAQKSQDAAGK